jgi:hypothetical protein
MIEPDELLLAIQRKDQILRNLLQLRKEQAFKAYTPGWELHVNEIWEAAEREVNGA